MTDTEVTKRNITKIPDANKATGLRLNGMGDMVTFQYAKHHTDDAQLKEEARQAVVDAGHDKAIKDLQGTVNNLRSTLDTANSKITELTSKVQELEKKKITYNEYTSSWDFKASNVFPTGAGANLTDLNLNGATLKVGDHVKTKSSGNQYTIVTSVTDRYYKTDEIWHSPENSRPQ